MRELPSVIRAVERNGTLYLWLSDGTNARAHRRRQVDVPQPSLHRQARRVGLPACRRSRALRIGITRC
jgi:hypothetical protein